MVVIGKPLKLKGTSLKPSSQPPSKEIAKPVMTEAERVHRLVQKRRVQDKAPEDLSYRDKVQQYNKRLASYSDHFDLQKTSD